MIWQTSRFQLDLTTPRVMGIVNVTPDSFSDGGRYQTVTAALRHCERLILDGADILDLGGESSRPGSVPVPLAEELARVLPLVREAVKLGVLQPDPPHDCTGGYAQCAARSGISGFGRTV